MGKVTLFKMSFNEMNDKQLKDRMRYLSDKMDALWEKVSPILKEFDESKNELLSIIEEIENRGLNDAQTHAGKGTI